MIDRRMPEPKSPFTDALKREHAEKPPHTGEKLGGGGPGAAKTDGKPGGTGPVENLGIDSPS